MGDDGSGTYKFYVPDIETQQVAFIGTVREGARADRTHVWSLSRCASRSSTGITEVEQLEIRPSAPRRRRARNQPPSRPPGGHGEDGLAEPGLPRGHPGAKRPCREEMVKTANYYFAGPARDDGKDYYPFTDDCGGSRTGCADQEHPAPRRPRAAGTRLQAAIRGGGEGHRLTVSATAASWRSTASAASFSRSGSSTTMDQLDLAARRAVQDRERQNPPDRGGVPPRPFGINSGWSTYEQGLSEEPQVIR